MSSTHAGTGDALVERDVESAGVVRKRAPEPTRGRARGAGREPMQPPEIELRDEARAALADRVDVERRRRARLSLAAAFGRVAERDVACDRSRPCAARSSPPFRRAPATARDERRVSARAARRRSRPPARRARRRRRRPRRRRCSSRRRRRARDRGAASVAATAPRAAERHVGRTVAPRVAVALVPPPLAAEDLDVERRRTVAEAPAAFGRV